MKIVQCDSRGQIIIPKQIREELKLKKDSAFWIYISKRKIVLEKVNETKKETKDKSLL